MYMHIYNNNTGIYRYSNLSTKLYHIPRFIFASNCYSFVKTLQKNIRIEHYRRIKRSKQVVIIRAIRYLVLVINLPSKTSLPKRAVYHLTFRCNLPFPRAQFAYDRIHVPLFRILIPHFAMNGSGFVASFRATDSCLLQCRFLRDPYRPPFVFRSKKSRLGVTPVRKFRSNGRTFLFLELFVETRARGLL